MILTGCRLHLCKMERQDSERGSINDTYAQFNGDIKSMMMYIKGAWM